MQTGYVRTYAAWILLGGVLVVAWFLTGRWLLSIALAAVIFMGFRMYLMQCLARRKALFEKQLVEALDLGGRSLRAFRRSSLNPCEKWGLPSGMRTRTTSLSPAVFRLTSGVRIFDMAPFA